MKNKIIKKLYTTNILFKLSIISYLASFIALALSNGILDRWIILNVSINVFLVLFVAGMLFCGFNALCQPSIWEQQKYELTEEDRRYMEELLKELK
jgi:uncharacterized membrane protein